MIISIDKKLLVEKEKLRQARLKETQQARRIIKLQQAEKNSVEALRAKLALVTNAWTKLTSAELKNTKRGKRLVNSKLKLTNQLKKLEKATGDNRREVGNYSLATDKLTRSLRGASRMLGQFGLALGGAALIRSTVSILSEFDEGLLKRPAIYIPYAQAVPNYANIDPDYCVQLNTGECKICTEYTICTISFYTSNNITWTDIFYTNRHIPFFLKIFLHIKTNKAPNIIVFLVA